MSSAVVVESQTGYSYSFQQGEGILLEMMQRKKQHEEIVEVFALLMVVSVVVELVFFVVAEVGQAAGPRHLAASATRVTVLLLSRTWRAFHVRR